MRTRMVAMRTAVAHSMPVANGMPLAAIGAREEVPPCPRRLRLPPSCTSSDFVMKLQLAVVGLRRRHIYGHTRQRVLSVTM